MTPEKRTARKSSRLAPPPRVVIEGVEPEIDGGRYPIKRTAGETIEVTARIFADGHDALAAALLYRPAGEKTWREAPMELVNWGLDTWRGRFTADAEGRWEYTLRGWVDSFRSWRRDLAKKVEAGQDVGVDLLAGAEIVAAAATRARGEDRKALDAAAEALRTAAADDQAAGYATATDEELAARMDRCGERRSEATYTRTLAVVVDRERARFSSWYEMFPRSAAATPGRHGTFRDCEQRLEYVASMGFDVLYFPPIHPIGRAYRKGPNNNPASKPGDHGSPWAIGGEEGGHTAIHPELGTLADFRRLVARARDYGMEVALDLAYQCSPDHPWVREHPEWFRKRPDGTIQYAENPPKKYQDIYPIDFETAEWEALWKELKGVVEYWAEQGVRIFRVDNPHTKSFAFWEWMIAEVKGKYPDVLFLSEAFTRPAVMYLLAKLGFTQSYTYFAWRNTKRELTDYLTELTATEVREYFRPNLWPNTPDILTEYLQADGRPAFVIRYVLAATLGASYGIYGPAFELCENRPLIPGREEYLDSEKYQLRHWDLESPQSLRGLIAQVNRIRRENPALQQDRTLRFHAVDNEELIAYSKSSADGSNVILVVVSLDPHHKQSGFTGLDLAALGVDPAVPFQVHDLLDDSRYLWHGVRNYLELDPAHLPAHIFRVRRRVRSERDFDYFA